MVPNAPHGIILSVGNDTPPGDVGTTGPIRCYCGDVHDVNTWTHSDPGGPDFLRAASPWFSIDQVYRLLGKTSEETQERFEAGAGHRTFQGEWVIHVTELTSWFERL